MQINNKMDNNLYAMVSAEAQVGNMASNIANVANTVGDPKNQEVTQELIDSIVGQIPEVVSYEANAQGIVTQQEVTDSLLNIKA
ncbi:MAG: hypothetical protein ACQERD_01295 [Campylobacterota bacterium]